MSTEEITRLRSAVTDMDALSQEGFSEIGAIARLALRAMKADSIRVREDEDIAGALRVIQGKANMIESCINAEAENVGCNWVSEVTKKRVAAMQEARS